MGAWIAAYDLKSAGKWVCLSAVVGVVAGLGAIAFHFLHQLVQYAGLVSLAGWHGFEPAGEFSPFPPATGQFVPWAVILTMALGGLLSGWLVYRFAPEAEGHGTDAAIDAFHNRRGEIRGRVPIIKTVASAVTLGTGGSAGREGPIAQIGAGFGSVLATHLKLAPRDRRVLLAAGMGAGVGAIFRAPLAGALFAGEILYRDADLETEVVVPAAMASIIGYSVFSLSLPTPFRFMPLFGAADRLVMASPLQLVPYSVLALVLTAIGGLYVATFYATRDLFRRLPIPAWLRPGVGAALAGGVGVILYFLGRQNAALLSVLGTGYGALQMALNSNQITAMASGLLLAVALLKIVTTSLTISSGGSGGVFGPSMVIGGCLGGSVGLALHHRWPELVPQPSAFAIVGMAGFFAGCARAPFSTIMMVTELTGGYHLLLPTMWVSTLCFLLSHRWTLYEKQVHSRLTSPAHRGDFIVDVLEGLHVADVFRKDRKCHTIPESTSLEGIVHMLAHTRQNLFPVVNREGQLVGVFTSDDVRGYLYDETLWKLANARDVMTSTFVSVTPRDDLNTAMQRFTALNVDELPVLDPDHSGKLLGLVGRKEVISLYNQRVMELKRTGAE